MPASSIRTTVPVRFAALAFACALVLASMATTAGASALARPIDDRALALADGRADEPREVGGFNQIGDPLLGAKRASSSSSTPSPALAALKSLAIPGWGQLATGHRTQAAIFGALEFGTWVAYGTFERQGALRRDSYFLTARLFAGIDLTGKSDAYRRNVGQYESSDVYNQFVVRREAAYFYPDSATRAQYYATYSIPAANAWSWTSFDDFLRYRAERRDSEHAFQRAKYALGFAVVNRLTSALAALRQASSARRAAHHATLLDDAPGHPVASLGVDVSPGPGLVPDARLACVVRF
jgi:hypothetical protein